MRRYYLSKIVGTGQTPEDAFRPKTHDVILDQQLLAGSVHAIHINPKTGETFKDWCLVIIDAADHSAFMNDADIKALPDFELDAKLSDMSPNEIIFMALALNDLGVTNVKVYNGYKYADVIRQIGKLSGGPNFEEKRFIPSNPK